MSCNKCNKSRCNHCHDCDGPCACPVPFLGIDEIPDNVSILRFNINGKRTDYDYTNLVYQTQTDTSLITDIVNRLLIFSAERHTDSITARELGSILHLADIGDVNTTGAENGSMLTYQKGTNCAEGCVGLRDSWKVWNALDEQISSATYPFVFAADGTAQTLQRPTNPSQFYMLGWNGKNQVSYSQVQTVTAAPTNLSGKKLALYLDPNTKEIVAVEEN